MNSRPLKKCLMCEEVKFLDIDYYKAGSSWQKYCKVCHNKKRKEYKNNSKYIKRKTGFLKLPQEIQEKIKYDMYVRVSMKDICIIYNLNYITFCRWKKKGQITQYNE